MAGLCYFRTNRTHTSTKKELFNQDRIVQNLLEEKGFSKTLIQEMKTKENPYNQETERENFTGLTVYDKVSNRHKFVKNVIKNSNLDTSKYYLPADIPGKKIEQFVFTIKKMRKQLNFE